jgi:TRAP transporter TAXI family solute receptor
MTIVRNASIAVALAAVLAWAGTCGAQDRVFFGIATGEPGSLYYPLGGMVAQLISNKVTVGGKKLAATGEASAGSVANAQLLGRNEVESGFIAADILDAAYNGKAPFEGKPLRNLRALGALYPELAQLVIAAKSPVRTFRDLKGTKIGVVGGASSLLPDLLDANGMTRKDVTEDASPLPLSLQKLGDGALAATLVLDSAPIASIADFAGGYDLRIVPLSGPDIDALRKKRPYYVTAQLPAYTYKGQVAPVDTVAVMTIWATHANMSNEMAYEVTKALFENLETLGQVHAKGREISLRTAWPALPIPLHPGAEKYYREKGLLK